MRGSHPTLRSPSILGALIVVNETRENRLRAVGDGDCLYLRRQLVGDRPHLLADVVLEPTLSEREIPGMLMGVNSTKIGSR